MAKPRYLPYGYRIQNGLITPDTLQAIHCKKSRNTCKPTASHTVMRQVGTRTPSTAS